VTPKQLAAAVAQVISLLAWEGQSEAQQADRAFAAGMRSFSGGDSNPRLLHREECSLADFDAALHMLNQTASAVKRRVINACAACIVADRKVTVREAELLRAIGDTLDCPLPPLVAD